MNIQDLPWSKWDGISERNEGVPDRPGVYQVRTPRAPVCLPRNKCTDGILYIGCSEKGEALRKRIGDIRGGRNNDSLFSHHSFGQNYWRYREEAVPVFGEYDLLEIRWAETPGESPVEVEGCLLEAFFRAYLSLPPFNFKF
jgi:hypothetical protein